MKKGLEKKEKREKDKKENEKRLRKMIEGKDA